VAYDEDLAIRIRELVQAERGVTEQRMFGGLAFLIDGNMAIRAFFDLAARASCHLTPFRVSTTRKRSPFL
jgi:hypothetical protein